jgi:N-carbamoyl-L-amino-acid hydrolase
LCALLLGAGDARPEDSTVQARHINPQRLQATLERLSAFGRNPEGGVTRLGFSQADLDARTYVTGLMKDAGLEVRVDPAGNIFGRRAGSEQLPTLLFGSHIDSVPHGGNFDGPLGSLGAIEVVRALNDGLITTRHPLEVVIWTNEEGPHFGISALGSGVAAGVLGAEILDRKDDDGQPWPTG